MTRDDACVNNMPKSWSFKIKLFQFDALDYADCDFMADAFGIAYKRKPLPIFTIANLTSLQLFWCSPCYDNFLIFVIFTEFLLLLFLKLSFR